MLVMLVFVPLAILQQIARFVVDDNQSTTFPHPHIDRLDLETPRKNAAKKCFNPKPPGSAIYLGGRWFERSV